MPKIRRSADETDAIVKRMRRLCATCGRPFAVHGATPPHTRGETPDDRGCAGFKTRKKVSDG